MKKLLTLAVFISMVIGVFGSFGSGLNLTQAGVAGSVLDQSYEAHIGSTVINSFADRVQTFRPTKNRIVSVEVSLANRQPGHTITLQIIDEGTGAVVGTESHQMTNPPGDAWETFAFTSPFVTVTPEARYGLKLSVNDPATQWYYGNNGYARGYFKVNASFDADFRVYGLTVDAPPPATPPADTSGQPSATPSLNQNATTVPVDESIQKPVLTYIEKNSEKKNAPITEEIQIKSSDKLLMVGTVQPGYKVVVFIGDSAYFAETDTNGKWTFTAPISGLAEGVHTIKAQTQTVDASKGSEKTDLFKLNKLAEKKEEAKKDEDKSFPWLFVGLGLAGLLAIATGIGTYIYLRKKKKGRIEKVAEKPEAPKQIK